MKGFGLQAGAEEVGGRTMLAFDAEEYLAVPTMPRREGSGGSRAVTAEGALEDLEGSDPLGTENDDDYLGAPPQVRNLDSELAKDAAMAPTRTIVKLELELEGPMAQLQAVLSALVNKSIELPPITIRIRQPARD